jgi:hypothetical protein
MKQLFCIAFTVVLTFPALTYSESTKHSTYVEGTVVNAKKLRASSGGITTKITLQEDAGVQAVQDRRFCGDWQRKIDRLRGKRIHMDLYYKEYAPSECLRIRNVAILSDTEPKPNH